MAENLSVPAEFEKPKSKGINMNLLPPSAFHVKPKSGDPWKEIAKATEEVAKLKMENIQLKQAQVYPKQSDVANQPLQAESERPQSEMCKYSSKKEDFKYVDELINKQACEITELKNELRALKCKHREEITEMERQLTQKEREYIHKITSLEVELKAAEDRYENQVDRLSREHQRECEDLQAMLDKVENELQQVRGKSKERIDLLGAQLDQLKTSSEERIDLLLQELKSKEVMIGSQSKEIAQLKKYIGETENLPKPSELARKENASLMAKLKVYETEKENTSSTIQLLNIRLNSLNEILKLQELEINKNNAEEKSKTENLLLTRWREKVFALMVQQKSTAVVNKKDEHNWKAKVHDLEERLNSAKNQIQQLSHTLSDREAQLNMETNTATRLQGELSEAQQLALCLDDRIQENVGNAHILQQCAASVWSKFEEGMESMNTALATLKSYNQRITFAGGRLEMLQGLFARKEAMLKMQLEETSVPVKDTPQPAEVFTENDQEDNSYLRCELERVTKERDNLVAQIKQDSLTWDTRVTAVRAEVREELDGLTQTKADLESIVREKQQKLSELSEKLDTSEKDLVFANETVEDLKTKLAKQESLVEQLLDEQRKEVENQVADRMADLERQLNDSKREHAKAVVSLRQLERQTTREKERAAEQMAVAEEHYRRQIQMLEDGKKAVEKERNLMMATLRQEGLIGKLRSERPEPVLPDWESSHAPQLIGPSVTEQSETLQPDTTAVAAEDMDVENLTTVLEDLKSLTDAVLKDDSDTASDTDV